ncbi:ribonuclease Z [Mangrovicella endophytica]|uniref:ribonuclease Z n=1 Tax=Mangrovicella endophytica TaxID=2066697 RepID=UPI000C9E1486|nr:MBL fold metallo-hydrolase [Mangrovicella endophytica]
MSRLVETRLVNGPFDDPGLLLDLRFGRRAVLFDLGDIAALSPREIGRLTHVFVSHRHMDHFAGFDRLLRLHLHRPGVLSLVGPPGFVEGVAARLGSYSWNLLDEGSVDLVIHAADFEAGRLGPATAFAARRAFRPAPIPPGAAPLPPRRSTLPLGLVLDDPDFTVEAVTLDHGLPCLAFALQERLRVNVWPEGLERLGLPVGPWLTEAKRAIRSGTGDDHAVTPLPGRSVSLGVLKAEALRVAPGQRVAYVVDAACTPANEAAILALAKGADHLFIEAAFLDEDREIAAERRHLTAQQAGSLARRADAKRLTVLHHSPRYLDRPDALRREAEAAFADT